MPYAAAATGAVQTQDSTQVTQVMIIAGVHHTRRIFLGDVLKNDGLAFLVGHHLDLFVGIGDEIRCVAHGAGSRAW